MRLSAFRAFVSNALSYLICLHALRAFATYAPSCLTCFRVFSRFSDLFKHFTRLTCTPYLCASCFLLTRLKILLGWIYSPWKIFKFPRTIKVITNRAVFMRLEKQPHNLFRWGSSLSINYVFRNSYIYLFRLF